LRFGFTLAASCWLIRSARLPGSSLDCDLVLPTSPSRESREASPRFIPSGAVRFYPCRPAGEYRGALPSQTIPMQVRAVLPARLARSELRSFHFWLQLGM